MEVSLQRYCCGLDLQLQQAIAISQCSHTVYGLFSSAFLSASIALTLDKHGLIPWRGLSLRAITGLECKWAHINLDYLSIR